MKSCHSGTLHPRSSNTKNRALGLFFIFIGRKRDHFHWNRLHGVSPHGWQALENCPKDAEKHNTGRHFHLSKQTCAPQVESEVWLAACTQLASLHRVVLIKEGCISEAARKTNALHRLCDKWSQTAENIQSIDVVIGLRERGCSSLISGQKATIEDLPREQQKDFVRPLFAVDNHWAQQTTIRIIHTGKTIIPQKHVSSAPSNTYMWAVMEFLRTLWQILWYTSVVLTTLTRSNSIEDLPMERLNLWIDRKEIEQFVGEWWICRFFWKKFWESKIVSSFLRVQNRGQKRFFVTWKSVHLDHLKQIRAAFSLFPLGGKCCGIPGIISRRTEQPKYGNGAVHVQRIYKYSSRLLISYKSKFCEQ